MSEASKRGRDFEMRIAKLIRQKMGIKAGRDKKSGAGDFFKADIRVPGQNLHIEAKSQGTIKLGLWWDQTKSGSGYKTPVLMIDMGGYEDLAVLRISDLLDMLRTMKDDAEALTEIRSEQVRR